ncbi:MAG: DEAD/DEAH box helicase, partial [Deltaproteobacteria bacterium]
MDGVLHLERDAHGGGQHAERRTQRSSTALDPAPPRRNTGDPPRPATDSRNAQRSSSSVPDRPHRRELRRPVASIAEFLESIRREAELHRALRHHEILDARPPELAAPPPRGFEATRPLLERSRIEALYSHQRRALERIAAGDDVVLATPTASGKTLVYNLPVLERALADPGARALYLFPLKALERDQRERLERDIAALGTHSTPPTVAIYDGDTPTAQRRRMREAPPSVLITTPDMLHFG